MKYCLQCYGTAELTASRWLPDSEQGQLAADSDPVAILQQATLYG